MRREAVEELVEVTRLDYSSAGLLLVGLLCGALAYWLIVVNDANPLLLVPSTVAATIGATHLTKPKRRTIEVRLDGGRDEYERRMTEGRAR